MTGPIQISVIVCTHNPDDERLRRTLTALRAQHLPQQEWETLLVDNASQPEVPPAALGAAAPANLRIVREPALGLSQARRRGFAESRGEIAVLVDDDNVLAPDYLAEVGRLFAAHPRVGVLGGKSLPEFTETPAAWTAEFHALLALRDLGATPLLSHGLRPAGATRNEYPAFAPIGAGMALRRAAWSAWLGRGPAGISDRRGAELSSSGDNDIVLSAMRAGWEAGYFPALRLTHLIPPTRLDPDYLARLNHGIQKSWMQVLARHEASPWPAIAGWTVPLRKFKAWFGYRAWSSPAARIRWRGACGHFEGRARA